MDFAESLRARGARSLAVFGDSITVGLNASSPELTWPQVLARAAGVDDVRNCGVVGTILQGSAMADGVPRAGNGVGRYRDVLLGQARVDGVAILYGYNDARYTGAPQTVNLQGFMRDYRVVLGGLLDGGYERGAIAIGSPPYLPDAGFSIGGAWFTGQTRAGFETYVRAVAALAREFRVYYAPVYEAMAGYDNGALASVDVTHPNDLGHAVIARAFGGAALVD